MKQKLIQAKSSQLVATVWQKISEEEQQLAIDLISNIICDYYFSKKKGENDESNHRKQD